MRQQVHLSICIPTHSPCCRAVPILTVSSVTGYNLDLVKKFLNTLPPLLSKKEVDKREQEPHEFQVSLIITGSDCRRC